MKLTIIHTDDIQSKKYSENVDKADEQGLNHCPICGKGVVNEDLEGLKNGTGHWLHMFGGGNLLTDTLSFPEHLLNGEDWRFHENADLGCWPVGETCWKKWLCMKNSGKYDVEV